MTDEQINRAIAEACGWRMEDGVWVWTANGIDCTYYELWDWANDLNAMHEACELAFSESTAWSTFAYKLLKIVCTGHYTDHDTLIMTNRATARQRAEAFLRTVGKWEEVQP